MSRSRLIAVLLSVVFAGTAAASGGGPPPGTKSDELKQAEKLIKAEKWDDAVKVLTQAAEKEPKNPDVFNWLGYAERHRGNMDAAFGHYEKALQLDPKHRGAHEYVGEAYLMVDQPDKAKEHLAALEKLCKKKCEEYEDLEKAIDAYQKKHAS